jgi:glucose/arabinose dehydrogenase
MSAAAAMSHWLSSREAPVGFTIDRDCELKTPDDLKSTVRYARHTLEIDEVPQHIASGKVPTQLALTWHDRVSFMLTETGQVKKLKLLDVVLDPKFAENRWVYWTYAEAGEGGNGVAVARGRLRERQLTEVQVIFRQLPKVDSQLHCGSRLAFGRDGRLLVGLGDRFSRKDEAQNPANHLGKIVRIEPDGRVPADNPFVGRAGAAPEVFTLGHRNIQGLTVHPATGELWQTEHGPQGGDELNVIDAGRNYGWPLVTYGRNYGLGTRIGEEGPKPGFEQPLQWWAPVSMAPSGMTFVTSDRYPGWKGSVLVGALRAQTLVRLTLDGRKVVAQEQLLASLQKRIRDVRQGPDGWIYLVTDGVEGQVIRLER